MAQSHVQETQDFEILLLIVGVCLGIWLLRLMLCYRRPHRDVELFVRTHDAGLRRQWVSVPATVAKTTTGNHIRSSSFAPVNPAFHADDLDGSSVSVFYVDEAGVYVTEEELIPSAPVEQQRYRNKNFASQLISQ